MKSIVIADPAPLVIEGIEHILSAVPDIHIKGSCFSFSSLKESMVRFIPDVLLFDGSLSHLSGGIGRFDPPWKCWPQVKTILFHTETNAVQIRRFLKDGVRSYLLRSVEPAELLHAVETVLENKIYVQESVRQAVLEQSLGLCSRKIEHLHLTTREMQIIELIVEEYTTHEIAEKLFVSFNTVESHRKNLIMKLGVKNSAGIVREAMRLKLYPSGV